MVRFFLLIAHVCYGVHFALDITVNFVNFYRQFLIAGAKQLDAKLSGDMVTGYLSPLAQGNHSGVCCTVFYYALYRRGALSDAAIRPSICRSHLGQLSVQSLARHAAPQLAK